MTERVHCMVWGINSDGLGYQRQCAHCSYDEEHIWIDAELDVFEMEAKVAQSRAQHDGSCRRARCTQKIKAARPPEHLVKLLAKRRAVR